MRPIDWSGAPGAVVPRLERRQVVRGTAGEPDRAQVVPQILGTFHEMLGLRLTLADAQRMFGLREATCRVVLDDLVKEDRLRRTSDGRYTLD
jgi:hypothetical protein